MNDEMTAQMIINWVKLHASKGGKGHARYLYLGKSWREFKEEILK